MRKIKKVRHIESGIVYELISTSRDKVTVKSLETGEVKVFDDVEVIMIYHPPAQKKTEILDNIAGNKKFYTKMGQKYYKHSYRHPKVGVALPDEVALAMLSLETLGVVKYNSDSKKMEIQCEISRI